jgi:hypothetical protein
MSLSLNSMWTLPTKIVSMVSSISPSRVTALTINSAWSEAKISNDTPVFLVIPSSPLWNIFLIHLTEDSERRFWNCETCRIFVETYGGLATIDKGKIKSLLWNTEVKGVENSFIEMAKAVENGTIKSVFRSTETKIGKLEKGKNKINQSYYHLTYNLPTSVTAKFSPETVHYDMLNRIVADNTRENVDKAYVMLRDGKLSRSSQHLAPIEWLRNLLIELDKGNQENKKWIFMNLAFDGCLNTLRSGVLSNLLEWIKNNLQETQIQTNWNNLVNPTTYMRPTTLSDGNIKAAEKLFEEMKIPKDHLNREYLQTLPERAIIWKNNKIETMFGDLKVTTNSTNNLGDSTPKPISLNTFFKEIQEAQKIEVNLANMINLFSFITGLPNTTEFMQWHNKENLASVYTWPSGTHTGRTGLSSGWNEVKSIAKFPYLWDGDFHKRHGLHYLVQLNAYDPDSAKAGLGLFPEFMKSEYHPVRSVIEAYSRTGKISGSDKPYICGILFGEGQLNNVFRISKRGLTSSVKITCIE